jgi:drug/metabolite transporter (DMT)-like permease
LLPASRIAPVQYTPILWGVILGAVIYGEVPDRWTIAGLVLIAGAGLLAVRTGIVDKKVAPDGKPTLAVSCEA